MFRFGVRQEIIHTLYTTCMYQVDLRTPMPFIIVPSTWDSDYEQ